MTTSSHFSSPGEYRIEARGILSSEWSGRFGSMQVISSQSADGDRALTVMQGWVHDQAELAGILNTLYELHLSLLSVQYLKGGPPVSG
jgi:hypothetical protein